MRKLVVVFNLPSPHRVPLFDLLSDRLRGAGWELEVVFGSRTNARRRWQLDDQGWRFRHKYLDGKNFSLATDRILNTYDGLGRTLENAAPDALVCLGFSAGTMTGARYAARARIPWAIWSGAVEGSERGWLRRMQRRWLVARATAFLAYGTAARDYLLGLGAPRDRVLIAWNTMDVARFLQVRLPPRNGTFRLLYTGHLERGKRVDLLLRAVARARRQRVPVQLDIVGDGSERALLEVEAERLSLGSAARFHGFCKHDGIERRYGRAHAFAFPTQYDVWGLALVEAMAAGLPAVASVRAGATRDLVVDGVTGFRVDFQDTDATADRLARLAASPRAAAGMGAAARKRIRNGFTLEKSAEGWLEMVGRW